MASRDQIRGPSAHPAPVATSARGRGGAAAEPQSDGPDDTVSRNLRQKAMYENLMEAVVADENCQPALKAVKRNKGAAGIDRMTTAELDGHLEANWWILRDKLLKGTYVPSPVRRVEIPKPSGGTRMLGIPTVQDRFIQQLLLQALTPIFDPAFSEHSYGFRPGRASDPGQKGAAFDGEISAAGSHAGRDSHSQ